MIYKFKSIAAPDLIMLEAIGRRMLEIIGRDLNSSDAVKGILQCVDMPAALTALQGAVDADDAHRQSVLQSAKEKGEAPPCLEAVSLRQRALPFMDMLRLCQREEKDIVWGV